MKQNLIGKRFGRLTVVSLYGKNDRRENVWECICDCGGKAFCSTANLKSGNSKSCGCLVKENMSKVAKKHGLRDTSLYDKWTNMKTRCFNPNAKSFDRYGGRGITVCEEWKNDFVAFYNWSIENGYNESLSLDRIDVNGNYEPSNCRWISMEDQAKNKRNTIRVEFDGEKRTLKEIAELLDEPLPNIRMRYYRGTLTKYLKTKGR